MKLKHLLVSLFSLSGALSALLIISPAHAKPVQINGEWLIEVDCQTGRPIDPDDANLIPGGVAAQSDIRKIGDSPIASESMPQESESDEPQESEQEEPPEEQGEESEESDYQGEEGDYQGEETEE